MDGPKKKAPKAPKPLYPHYRTPPKRAPTLAEQIDLLMGTNASDVVEFYASVVKGEIPAPIRERLTAGSTLLAYRHGTPVNVSAHLNLNAATGGQLELGEAALANLLAVLSAHTPTLPPGTQPPTDAPPSLAAPIGITSGITTPAESANTAIVEGVVLSPPLIGSQESESKQGVAELSLELEQEPRQADRPAREDPPTPGLGTLPEGGAVGP